LLGRWPRSQFIAGEWATAFPNANSWASPRVRERARARHVDVDFTRDLEASPSEEWGREIDFCWRYFKEFIFFHKASKTLILADTIINIELDKITEPWRTATRFTGMYHLWSDFLRHAASVTPAAPEGGGGNQKNPLVAAAACFAQPWPMFRCRCRQSNP